jgi:ribonuclease-3
LNYATLIQRLGTSIEAELLELALTHSSYAYENGKIPNNERLEFLGDSVLGFVVTGHVFEENPDLDEGSLSRLRSATVSAKTLALAANQIGLGEFIRLGKGELSTGGETKTNILADTFEAIIGAAYLSGGLTPAKTIIDSLVLPLLSSEDELLETSEPRTVLTEVLKSQGKSEASFDVTHEGPDHDRTFFAEVVVDGAAISKGSGRTRKAAEAQAAVEALKTLRG